MRLVGPEFPGCCQRWRRWRGRRRSQGWRRCRSGLALPRRTVVASRAGPFEGQIITAADPLQSTATATIDTTSIDTSNENRDNDMRGENFRRREPPDDDVPVDRNPSRW